MMQPARIWLMITAMTMIYCHMTYAQHLGSARAVGVGAFTALSNDVNAIDWNPAGLVGLRDWEFLATSYYSPAGSERAATMQLAAIGKRFMDDHAVSLRLSPGMVLDFIIPSTFTFKDSAASFVTTFDKKISYAEYYAFGYAFRAGESFSVGMSAHFLEEKVTDTKYSVDSNGVIHSFIVDYPGNAWTIDWGMLWSVNDSWCVGLVAKNLFRITEQPIDEVVRRYDISTPKILRCGVAYSGLRHAKVALDGDTEKMFRLGGEYSIGENFFLRGGMYMNASSAFSADAAAFGIGTSFRPLNIDLSYLTFFNQSNRRGSADIDAFQQTGVNNIEFNPFTSDRFSLTATLNLGRSRESLARIEYVEMLSDVFPASQPVYAFRPIGKARVRNTSLRPINAKVSFYVEGLMDAPTETKPYAISPGDVVEVPFFAVFNSAVRLVKSMVVNDGDVYVNAAPAQDYDDRYQTRVLIRGRNDWNGDVMLLKYFVTPDDPDVLKFTRASIHQAQVLLDSVVSSLQNFYKARVLFDKFAQQLTYVSDPKNSQDFVQYPGETLSLHGGDCDDMTVCYSSLLASVGISSAYVDVIPPARPDSAHIYLLFDTGVPASDANMISENSKRYVIRKGENGRETIWIPIETTAITKGFDEAWNIGALEYFNDVGLNLGLVQGWVKVVDLQITY